MHYVRYAKNKYGNKRTEYQGRKYDSKLEAGVAVELELLQKSGQVIKVEPQKTFDLYGKNGGKICGHRPDFLVTFKDGHQEVWEAKGIQTDTFRIKLKLFEDNYPEIDYYVIKGNNRYYAHKATRKPYTSYPRGSYSLC